MWDAIAKAADRIERVWSQTGYGREAFPELAGREVEALLGDGALGVDAILATLASTPRWSEQLDPYTQFGEPAITVYKTERWNLDVYFWLHPVTALHDHRFCGAFGVVEGLTLNSTYAFHAREPAPDGVEAGRLVRERSELLRAGAVRRILPGRGFIHQVVHVARPTVSVALRTLREPDLPFQREYFWPGLSVPSLQYLSHPQRRKLDLIGTLVSLRQEKAAELIARMVALEDETCAFWMLYRLFHASGMRAGAVTQVLDASASPLGRLRRELLDALGSVAESALYWNLARQEPHRLLVALALSVQDPDEIARLVEEYSGGTAAETVILEWLAGMKKEEETLGWLANVGKRVGPMARLDLGPRSSLLLRSIVAGRDRDEILRRSRSAPSEAESASLAHEIDALVDRLGGMPLLRPFAARWKR